MVDTPADPLGELGAQLAVIDSLDERQRAWVHACAAAVKLGAAWAEFQLAVDRYVAASKAELTS